MGNPIKFRAKIEMNILLPLSLHTGVVSLSNQGTLDVFHIQCPITSPAAYFPPLVYDIVMLIVLLYFHNYKLAQTAMSQGKFMWKF